MAPVQNGSILGGDTVDKLVGMIFSPGRKNSSESSLSLSFWASCVRSSIVEKENYVRRRLLRKFWIDGRDLNCFFTRFNTTQFFARIYVV